MEYTIEMMSGATATTTGTLKIGDAGELRITDGSNVTIYGPTAWFKVTYTKSPGSPSAIVI